MKNLSGKTLIFYTFQQKKELQYNVIAYQAPQQPILIKDVIDQLPLNLSQGRYHFRFKSEFTEGNEKMYFFSYWRSGWIDINNLTAKVPLIGGSIYVKVLKVKSNAHNKMFNLEKLSRVGLGIKMEPSKMVSQKSSESMKKNSTSIPSVSASIKRQQKPVVEKPATQAKKQQFDLIDHTNQHSSNIVQQKSLIPTQQKAQVKVQVTKIEEDQNFLGFEVIKVFKNEETIQEKLDFFKKTMKAEEEHRQNERIARDELEQKINKWGYSGAKTINNLTTLLSTLHDIWPEWPQISLSELLKPQSLAAQTKKALIKTHPDKNRQKPFREKYLSKRVFELINEAKLKVSRA